MKKKSSRPAPLFYGTVYALCTCATLSATLSLRTGIPKTLQAATCCVGAYYTCDIVWYKAEHTQKTGAWINRTLQELCHPAQPTPQETIPTTDLPHATPRGILSLVAQLALPHTTHSTVHSPHTK